MTRDHAFQRALEISLETESDAVVFRSDLSDYGAMPLDLYDGYSSEIVATFENGVRID